MFDDSKLDFTSASPWDLGKKEWKKEWKKERKKEKKESTNQRKKERKKERKKGWTNKLMKERKMISTSSDVEKVKESWIAIDEWWVECY